MLIEVEMEHGLSGAFGLPEREQRPTRERAMGEDERAVGVADIEGGSHGRIGGSGLLEARVAIGDRSVLGEATPGHPAPDADVVRECEIQGGAIGARLSAGEDLHEHVEHRPEAGEPWQTEPLPLSTRTSSGGGPRQGVGRG